MPNMKSIFLTLAVFFITACNQGGLIPVSLPVTIPETTTTPTLLPGRSVLYRGDLGRTGSFDLPSLEAPVDVRW